MRLATSGTVEIHSCHRWRTSFLLPSRPSIIKAASASSGSSGGGAEWWENLNRNSIGPPPADRATPSTSGNSLQDVGSLVEELLGGKGMKQLEEMDKAERQRVWDAMRGSAWERYQAGTMPAWFDPNWLLQVRHTSCGIQFEPGMPLIA